MSGSYEKLNEAKHFTRFGGFEALTYNVKNSLYMSSSYEKLDEAKLLAGLLVLKH